MNVYPINELAGAALTSAQRATHSDLRSLHDAYFAYTVDFTSPNPIVMGTWSAPFECDTVIIGNTNMRTVRCTLRLGNTSGENVFTRTVVAGGEIMIITLPQKTTADHIRLTFTGAAGENMYLGQLFVGRAITLPRFVTLPQTNLQMRQDSERTFGGQVGGVPSEMLRTFAASFARVSAEDMRAIDEYAQSAQNVIPHFIDPYPEARGHVPPMFATIERMGERAKRAENTFYWNTSISWKEAK